MNHQELRQKFIGFFIERGHKLIPSSSLIPDDQSVLFTTAGVQQLKKYYTGQTDPIKDFGTKRLISIQKSLRTTDIDEVGDVSHGTFFEMLGYFSFGDYFKKETIEWTHDFLVNILGISNSRIRPTVFKGDEQAPFDKESFETWKALGFENSQIGLGNRKDNFWGPIGDEGPCGPANEVYIDDIEIGTLVFNEYFCDKNKELVALKQNGVDVGLGFERLLLFLQKVQSVYETDLFSSIMAELQGNGRSERIIADHIKASVFLIGDGALPSNVERGYILRRLLRRSIRHAKILGLPENFYEGLVKRVIDIYKDSYPALKKNQKKIIEAIGEEYGKFIKSLDRGLKEFENLSRMVKEKGGIISGADAFNLYQSFGFPVEFTRELALERGLETDLEGFEKLQKEHRETSRAGAEEKFKN